MALFTATGRAHFAQALAVGLSNTPYEVFLRVAGGALAGPFKVDRVEANDADTANQGRGTYVISFRAVVPAGAPIHGPCEMAEVRAGGDVLFKQQLNNFRASASHASVLYLNFALGERS